MKNTCRALIMAALFCGLLAASPAEAAKKQAAAAAPVKAEPAKTADAGDAEVGLYTKRSSTGVLALENLHVNGSTCMTCSNGIYGTGGTHNMHSNEF